MRREWSGIIKNRQWTEFESLAKVEPSQALADTVAELERGLTEKADRRALRKVLYILSQSGYEPQDIAEPDLGPVEQPKPLEFGYMASPDAAGATCFAYGVEKGGRVRCLIATVQPGQGIVDAFDRALGMEEARDFGRKFFSDFGAYSVQSAVPAAYALGRIGDGLRGQKRAAPSAIPYWRAILEATAPAPHPTVGMTPSESSAEERHAVPFMIDAAVSWRLELGSVMPMLEELYKSETSGLVLSEEQKRERRLGIFAKAREDLFTPEVVADHALRLRDLAYILHLKNLPDAGLALSAAVDLEKNAGESDYAKGLLDKTVALLLESWKESSRRSGPAMRRFQE